MEILQARNRFYKNTPHIIHDLLDIEAYIRGGDRYPLVKFNFSFEEVIELIKKSWGIKYESSPTLEAISVNLQKHTLTKGDCAIKEAFISVYDYVYDVDTIKWAEKRFAEFERTDRDKIIKGLNQSVYPHQTDIGKATFRVGNIFGGRVNVDEPELAFCMRTLLGACLVPPRIDRNIIDRLFKLYQIQWNNSIREMRDFPIEDSVKRIRVSDFSRIDSELLEKYCKKFCIDLTTQSGIEELIEHISKPVEFKVEVDWNASHKRINDLYKDRDISREHFDAEWSRLSPKQKYYHMAGLWNPETGRFPWQGVSETATPLNKSEGEGFDEYGGEDDILVDSDGFSIDDEIYSNLLDSVYSPEEKPMVNEVRKKVRQKSKSVLKEKV